MIAPDYIGFDYSDAPNANEFEYTFDNLAEHVEELLSRVLGQRSCTFANPDFVGKPEEAPSQLATIKFHVVVIRPQLFGPAPDKAI